MDKKYQMVAWTENVTDREKSKLYMIPSLHFEMQAPYFDEISRCREEVRLNSEFVSTKLARRFVRAYEENARYFFLTGYEGDGLRFLCKAALYCIREDDLNWTYWDTDLGHYSCFCGELRHEFTRLCRECLKLAEKHSLHHILLEKEPRLMMELFLEHTQEERDIARHLRKMKAWS